VAPDKKQPAPAGVAATGVDIFADRLMRVVPSLSTQALRMAFLRAQLQATTPAAAAGALNAVCTRAEGGDATARDVLLAFTGLLQEPPLQAWLESLRTRVDQQQLDALGRLLRRPTRVGKLVPSAAVADDERRVPDYGKGRSLTLGERKALARRPTRKMLDRLLTDPHPSVIYNLLNNSITTEDDIVRLAAKRPLRVEIMAEIARHPKWNVRRRVRLALVLNPGCPPELGVPLVGLLMRSELKIVVQLTDVHPEIRGAAADRLRR